MHEVGIAASILDAVRGELAGRTGVKATIVAVRLGALSGVDADALRFGFEALVRDSDLEPLRLEIENVSRRHKCLDCNHEYDATDNDTLCPACHSPIAVCIAGEELDIAWVEVEET